MGRGDGNGQEVADANGRRWPLREVNVWGSVPVGVTVDLETGEITRVTVIDESLRLPSTQSPHQSIEGSGELAVSTMSYSDEGITDEIAARAVEIANSEEVEWPSWDFGY